MAKTVLRGWHVTNGVRAEGIFAEGKVKPGRGGWYGPGIYAANVLAPEVANYFRNRWHNGAVPDVLAKERWAFLLEVEVEAEDIHYLSAEDSLNDNFGEVEWFAPVVVVSGDTSGVREEYDYSGLGQWKIARHSRYADAVKIVKAEQL